MLGPFLQVMRAETLRDPALMDPYWQELGITFAYNSQVHATLARASYYSSSRHGLSAANLAENHIQRRPNNRQLQSALFFRHRMWRDYDRELEAAEQAVRCARSDSDAWMFLRIALSDKANSIRKGRTADRITDEEWEVLNDYYEKALMVAVHATRLQPETHQSWLGLCQSATFASVEGLPDAAFDQALALAPADRFVLGWGLEIYQPKWLDMPEKLVSVANKLVEAAQKWEDEDRMFYAIRLDRIGLTAHANRLIRTDAERKQLEESRPEP